MIKVAQEILQQGTLTQYKRAGVFRAMQDIIAPTQSVDQTAESAFNQLTTELSPATILTLFEWLDYDKNTLSGIFIKARLEELAGNLEVALSYYQTLLSTPGASSTNKEFAQQAVSRLSVMPLVDATEGGN